MTGIKEIQYDNAHNVEMVDDTTYKQISLHFACML
uniref:Uncharacterized protein n=1 Tax=Anguilla anguilla TaxID=7936 RepID=A0A0E9RXY7_ANGAN